MCYIKRQTQPYRSNILYCLILSYFTLEFYVSVRHIGLYPRSFPIQNIMLIFRFCNNIDHYFITILQHCLLEEASPFLLLFRTHVYPMMTDVAARNMQ